MESTDNLPPQQIPTNRGSGGSFVVIIVAAAAVIVLGIAVCGGLLLRFGAIKSTSAAGITLDSGRTIRIVSDTGGVGASSSGDTGTFNVASTQIVVTPDSVTMNGIQVAELDPAAKQIEISFMSGAITVAADSAAVGKLEKTTLEPYPNSP